MLISPAQVGVGAARLAAGILVEVLLSLSLC
jgi:hypothetical protein